MDPQLTEAATRVRELRHELLIADEPRGVDAREFYMLAVHALSQAEAFLALALRVRP